MTRKGFTLIELMLVVAIIGILASIAIPKFAALVRKSSEGASKGNIGSVRSAINIYYADLEGLYPTTIAALTISAKYLSAIPRAKAPNYHADQSGEFPRSGAAAPNDAGGWYYDDLAGTANFGAVLVNCTHTDTKGEVWSAY